VESDGTRSVPATLRYGSILGFWRVVVSRCSSQNDVLNQRKAYAPRSPNAIAQRRFPARTTKAHHYRALCPAAMRIFSRLYLPMVKPDAADNETFSFPHCSTTVHSQGPKAPWQSGDSAALPVQNAPRRKPTPHPRAKRRRDVARGAEGGAVTTAPLRSLLTGVGMAENRFLRCARDVPGDRDASKPCSLKASSTMISVLAS